MYKSLLLILTLGSLIRGEPTTPEVIGQILSQCSEDTSLRTQFEVFFRVVSLFCTNQEMDLCLGFMLQYLPGDLRVFRPCLTKVKDQDLSAYWLPNPKEDGHQCTPSWPCAEEGQLTELVEQQETWKATHYQVYPTKSGEFLGSVCASERQYAETPKIIQKLTLKRSDFKECCSTFREACQTTVELPAPFKVTGDIPHEATHICVSTMGRVCAGSCEFIKNPDSLACTPGIFGCSPNFCVLIEGFWQMGWESSIEFAFEDRVFRIMYHRFQAAQRRVKSSFEMGLMLDDSGGAYFRRQAEFQHSTNVLFGFQRQDSQRKCGEVLDLQEVLAKLPTQFRTSRLTSMSSSSYCPGPGEELASCEGTFYSTDYRAVTSADLCNRIYSVDVENAFDCRAVQLAFRNGSCMVADPCVQEMTESTCHAVISRRLIVGLVESADTGFFSAVVRTALYQVSLLNNSDRVAAALSNVRAPDRDVVDLLGMQAFLSKAITHNVRASQEHGLSLTAVVKVLKISWKTLSNFLPKDTYFGEHIMRELEFSFLQGAYLGFLQVEARKNYNRVVALEKAGLLLLRLLGPEFVVDRDSIRVLGSNTYPLVFPRQPGMTALHELQLAQQHINRLVKGGEPEFPYMLLPSQEKVGGNPIKSGAPLALRRSPSTTHVPSTQPPTTNPTTTIPLTRATPEPSTTTTTTRTTRRTTTTTTTTSTTTVESVEILVAENQVMAGQRGAVSNASGQDSGETVIVPPSSQVVQSEVAPEAEAKSAKAELSNLVPLILLLFLLPLAFLCFFNKDDGDEEEEYAWDYQNEVFEEEDWDYEYNEEEVEASDNGGEEEEEEEEGEGGEEEDEEEGVGVYSEEDQ